MGRPSQELVSGRDYPRDWNQFQDWFPDEGSCRRYLAGLRWPGGYICPRCAIIDEPFRASGERLVCRHCRHQGTVTAGTIFDKTRTPLRTWLAAAWQISHQRGGVSALGLQRALGIGSYPTTWAILHRLRRALVSLGREPLTGIVEVDETLIAAPNPARRKPAPRQGFSGGTWIAIAVELHDPKRFGRVRLRRLAANNAAEAIQFVRDVAQSGSTVHTDGSHNYLKLADLGYLHHRIVHYGSSDPAHETMPGVHRVAALLKRWLLGTHQGAVRHEHLDRYLEEFTFRFNRRSSRSRGLIFYRLIEQAVATSPETYAEIVASAKPQDVLVGGAN